MLKIAHRGNCDGPNPELENSPQYLLDAIDRGADVEVDIWIVEDKFYLGHDEPTYIVDIQFLLLLRGHAWFHCKNLAALEFFTNSGVNYRYFWHQNDDYALTSNGCIWTYPGGVYGPHSIIVNLEPDYSYSEDGLYAICVDYLGDR